MSETPSWLKEEDTVKAVAKNSVVQSTAKAVATDPAVQKATYNAVKEHYVPPDHKDVGGDEESQSQANNVPRASQNDDDDIEDLNLTPDMVREMEKYEMILRGSFMVFSILMAAAACVKLENTDIATAFIALYVLFFAIVICCFELSLSSIARWLAMNFGFLYSLSGRILFLTFVAVMCFSLGIFGKIVMALTFAALLFNIYVLITYPDFDKWLRIKHYKKIKGSK